MDDLKRFFYILKKFLTLLRIIEYFHYFHYFFFQYIKVQDLSFSPNGKFIVTLGGQDDNMLLLWSVSSGRCLCGTPAANDSSSFVQYFNNDNDRLVLIPFFSFLFFLSFFSFLFSFFFFRSSGN